VDLLSVRLDRSKQTLERSRQSKIKISRFKPNQNSNRAPPILIQLCGDGDRSVILKAAKELRKLTEYKDIYINPDMTDAERILDKKRREDRFSLNERERNNASNVRFGISGDRFRKFIVEPISELDLGRMQH
jgi:hypothetical protein